VNLNEANLPVVLTSLTDPPSRQSVVQWLKEKNARESSDVASSSEVTTKKRERAEKQKNACDRSQLEAASLNNSFGFRVSFGNCLEAKAVHQVLNCLLYLLVLMTVM
jgi:hypothetical protein